MTKTVLDLFAGVGGFSQAFEESEKWEVITVELKGKFNPHIQADILNLRPSDLPEADVILASPPCLAFTTANNGHHIQDGIPATDFGRESVALVFHTIGLIKALAPDYWFLENPTGNLKQFMDLEPRTVTYCQYGAEQMKPTHLWGKHPSGMSYRSCSPGDSCHASVENPKGAAMQNFPDGSAERAKVPYGLSKEILESVEAAYENGDLEQSKLTEIKSEI